MQVAWEMFCGSKAWAGAWSSGRWCTQMHEDVHL